MADVVSMARRDKEWKVDYSPPVLALDEKSASSDTEAVDFEHTDQGQHPTTNTV
jgi:hypothetical protein